MVSATKTILAKREATYGVDATPTAAANAMVTRGFRVTPLALDQIERNLDVPSRGRQRSAPTNRRATRSFEIELAGSGAAGTAPGWMEVLEACGMAPAALTANTEARQTFVAQGVDCSSLTFHDWHDSQRRVGLGNRGTFTANFTAGQVPFLSFDFLGLIPTAGPMSTVAPGVPDFSRWREPIEVNRDNTDIQVGGYAVRVKSLTVEAGVPTAVRNLVGARYVRAGEQVVTGRMSIEAPTIAAKNYFTNLNAGDLSAFALTHGLAAGNIVGLSSVNLQVLSIDTSEEDDVLMYDIGFGLNAVAGQDDLFIFAK